MGLIVAFGVIPPPPCRDWANHRPPAVRNGAVFDTDRLVPGPAAMAIQRLDQRRAGTAQLVGNHPFAPDAIGQHAALRRGTESMKSQLSIVLDTTTATPEPRAPVFVSGTASTMQRRGATSPARTQRGIRQAQVSATTTRLSSIRTTNSSMDVLRYSQCRAFGRGGAVTESAMHSQK